MSEVSFMCYGDLKWDLSGRYWVAYFRSALIIGLLWSLGGWKESGWAQGTVADREHEWMEGCRVQMINLYSGMVLYYQDRHLFPARLSDLVPEYLSNREILQCPASRFSLDAGTRDTRSGEQLSWDPGVSYYYELFPLEIMGREDGKRYLEWKLRQESVVGSRVPMVRCPFHPGGFLNLSFGGEVGSSELNWEHQLQFFGGWSEFDLWHSQIFQDSRYRRMKFFFNEYPLEAMDSLSEGGDQGGAAVSSLKSLLRPARQRDLIPPGLQQEIPFFFPGLWVSGRHYQPDSKRSAEEVGKGWGWQVKGRWRRELEVSLGVRWDGDSEHEVWITRGSEPRILGRVSAPHAWHSGWNECLWAISGGTMDWFHPRGPLRVSFFLNGREIWQKEIHVDGELPTEFLEMVLEGEVGIEQRGIRVFQGNFESEEVEWMFQNDEFRLKSMEMEGGERD